MTRKPYEDLTGMKFGRLIVIGQAAAHIRIDGCEVRKWMCACECGVHVERTGGNLRRKLYTPSCGCGLAEKNRKRQRTHGFAGSGKEPMRPEYNSWKGMRVRCTNPRVPCFKHYGARGITVCERWSSFEKFYADMGPKPTPKHSIDRINNDGNYEPENCRWATSFEQIHNRRVSRKNRVSETPKPGSAEHDVRASSGT